MDEMSEADNKKVPTNGKPSWAQDEANPEFVRYWDGYAWKGPNMTIDFAILGTLHALRQENSGIRAQLDRIRFRVGFLALVVLIEIILGALLVLSAVNGISSLNS